MARPIKLKINYSRIVLDHLYEGKNGQYLDLVAWPNKSGPDQYGNTHFVCQDMPRDCTERGPILGNLRLPEDQDSGPRYNAPERKETANTEAARKFDEQRAAMRAREDQRADAAGPMSRPLNETDDDIPF